MFKKKSIVSLSYRPKFLEKKIIVQKLHYILILDSFSNFTDFIAISSFFTFKVYMLTQNKSFYSDFIVQIKKNICNRTQSILNPMLIFSQPIHIKILYKNNSSIDMNDYIYFIIQINCL